MTANSSRGPLADDWLQFAQKFLTLARLETEALRDAANPAKPDKICGEAARIIARVVDATEPVVQRLLRFIEPLPGTGPIGLGVETSDTACGVVWQFACNVAELDAADDKELRSYFSMQPTKWGPVFDRILKEVEQANGAVKAGGDRIGTTDATEQNAPTIRRLLTLFTNGIADERIERAAIVLEDDNLKAGDKLTKIDAIIRIPATASAEDLGTMLGISKQAIHKTSWWKTNRKGEKSNEIGRRRGKHLERASQHESDESDR